MLVRIASHIINSINNDDVAAADTTSVDAIKGVLDQFHAPSDEPMALQHQLGIIDECFSGFSLSDIYTRLKSKNTGTGVVYERS